MHEKSPLLEPAYSHSPSLENNRHVKSRTNAVLVVICATSSAQGTAHSSRDQSEGRMPRAALVLHPLAAVRIPKP